MGENEKATRYISQLDDARCNGRWQELPELARKIEKHAPHRTCLALTARAEAQVATYNEKPPPTATSEPSTSALSKLIPSLLTAIDHESDYAQDAFQATICLGWLHWVLEEPHLAVARFPKDFGAQLTKFSSSKAGLGNWTKVCIVKGAYLKGFSQEKGNQVADGVQTYCSILPFLSTIDSLGSASPQLKQWTERLLSRLCLLSDQSSPATSNIDSSKALQIFRIWGKLFEVKPGLSPATSAASNVSAASTRRRVWKAYYDTLSAILQQDLPFLPPGGALNSHATDQEKTLDDRLLTLRLQQRAELKRVETLYEAQLLEETQFPKSSQANTEIELWVDSVIENWRVLCGSTWYDEDLGEGGKAAVGREVLDILYRAATKTYHSTQILRYLFTVHASLAEFDLAFKAFDSYVDIMTRGRDREEKSGEEDLGLDDDDMMLRTGAEAIRILCRFGTYKEAEKARDIGQMLTKWLQRTGPSLDNSTHSHNETVESARTTEARDKATPLSQSVAYRAIGISHAQWARMTYDAPSRSRTQAEAIRNLKKALDPQFEDSSNVESLYSLALVMAERRDIPGAVKILKSALSQQGQYESSLSPDGVVSEASPLASSSEFIRERKLIPLWHLLALLLTARSEYFTAGKACEAAFEQFQDPTILFGPSEQTPLFKSSHLNDVRDQGGHKGLVDRMETFEKEGIIQVKLTQLALIEATEGATAAVDASDELLALYGRLFGGDKPAPAVQEQPATTKPPKSRAGTIRSTIFGRPKTAATAAPDAPPVPPISNVISPTLSDRPSTATQTGSPHAPAIQVTDENGSGGVGSVGRQRSRREGSTGPKRSESSRLRKKSVGSLRRPSQDLITQQTSGAEEEDQVPPLNGEQRARTNSVTSRQSRRRAYNQSIASSVTGSLDSPDQPLRNVAYNSPHSANAPSSAYSRQPPRQDVRLPAPFPRLDASPLEPRFPILQERRHKHSLLVGLWLFIGGLYTRAGLHEDAKEATQEARKLVEQLEEEVTKESPGSRALTNRGWGGGKSVQELWGDFWAARGELSQAQLQPHFALENYEKALSHFPDHPAAIVGLSTILLDIYGKVIPPEPSRTAGVLAPSLHSDSPVVTGNTEESEQIRSRAVKQNATPSELNRLTARDRAYGLLSSLTKLGSGWDFPEAWFVLARAYEEGGQIEKAKEVLWWCVELEDTNPVRRWGCIGSGGVVL